jgi:hypothetical protein
MRCERRGANVFFEVSRARKFESRGWWASTPTLLDRKRVRARLFLRGGPAVYDVAEHVDDHDVHFLDFVGGLGVGDDEGVIGLAEDFAAAAAKEGDGDGAFFPGGLESFEDVGGIAGGAEACDYVAGTGEGFDLAREDFFEAEVVGDAGEGGAVGGEGDGGEGVAGALVAADHFLGEVLGVGGAAAVAEGEELFSIPEGGAEKFAQLLDLGGELIGHLLGDGDVALDVGLDGVRHDLELWGDRGVNATAEAQRQTRRKRRNDER